MLACYASEPREICGRSKAAEKVMVEEETIERRVGGEVEGENVSVRNL